MLNLLKLLGVTNEHSCNTHKQTKTTFGCHKKLPLRKCNRNKHQEKNNAGNTKKDNNPQFIFSLVGPVDIGGSQL